MGKKNPYYGKSMNINFPGIPYTVGFVAFSHAMGYWCENPCISHVMKYTIEWESDGKKEPILWEKYEYQFPRFSPYDGFCCIFPCHGTWCENSCISHVMKYTIEWESDGKKEPILWEKYGYQSPRFYPYDGFCCIFPCYGILMRKPMHFPYDEIR